MFEHDFICAGCVAYSHARFRCKTTGCAISSAF
jgi:hypothetical protein